MNYMQIKIFCYAGNDTYMNLLTGEIYCTDGWDSYEFYEAAANEFVLQSERRLREKIILTSG